jgi:hypothetical protein
MLVNSIRGLEQMVNLRVVCGSDAQWWAETALCVCVPGISGWSQSELPLEDHKRRRNLCFLLQPSNQTSVLSMVKFTLCIKTKPRKSCQQSMACWWSFLTMRALFIRNLFVLTKQLTSITARRLFNIWGSKPAANTWNNGQTRLSDSP